MTPVVLHELVFLLVIAAITYVLRRGDHELRWVTWFLFFHVAVMLFRVETGSPHDSRDPARLAGEFLQTWMALGAFALVFVSSALSPTPEPLGWETRAAEVILRVLATVQLGVQLALLDLYLSPATVARLASAQEFAMRAESASFILAVGGAGATAGMAVSLSAGTYVVLRTRLARAAT